MLNAVKCKKVAETSYRKCKTLSRNKRIFFGCFALPLLLCGSALFIVLVIPRIGRISGFRPLSDNEPIPGTDYVIRFEKTANIYNMGKYDVFLENETRQSRFSLDANEDFYFSTFNFEERLYLITKVKNSGSADFWNYDVYDISNNEPIRQTHVDLNPGYKWVGASCHDPKLDADGLWFEGWTDSCAFSDWTPDTVDKYTE